MVSPPTRWPTGQPWSPAVGAESERARRSSSPVRVRGSRWVGRRAESLKLVADGLPGDTVVVPADLSRPEAPDEVMEALVSQLGQVDVLVNNAGGGNLTPSQDLTAEEADALWALNARAPLLLGAKAAAHMAATGGGSIVNVSSAVGATAAWPG